MTSSLVLIFLLALVSLLPGFIVVNEISGSHALGSSIAWLSTASISIVLLKGRVFRRRELFLILAILIFILTHFMLASYITESTNLEGSGSKFFYSLPMIILFLVSAISMSKFLMVLPEQTIDISFLMITLLMLSFGLVESFLSEENRDMFFFSERSHFSLTLAPFLIYTYTKVSNITKLAIFLASAMLVARFNSLTFAVIFLTLVALSVKTQFSLKQFIIMIIVSAVSINIFLFIIGSEYYSLRFSYSDAIDNLSLLVFLSGFERAFANLPYSFFIGAGFQQMGFESIARGVFITALDKQDMGHLNIYDGGTTAAKLIYEFGLIGLLICLSVAWKVLQSFAILNNGKISCHEHLAAVLILTSIFPLIVRGTGYFTFSIFICVVGMYLSSFLKRRRMIRNLNNVTLRPLSNSKLG